MARSKHNHSPASISNPNPGPHLWEIRAVRDIFWIALVILVIWLGYYLRSIFIPVIVSFFLAYLVNPIINWMQFRLRLHRSIVISFFLLIFFLGGAIFFVWFGPMLIRQVVTLFSKLTVYLQLLGQNLPEYQRYLENELDITLNFDVETIRQQIIGFARNMQERPMAILEGVFEGASQALGFTSQAFGIIGVLISRTTYIVLTLVLIPVYFFFFALYFDPMIRSLIRYIPKSHRAQVVSVVQRMDLAVSSFFRGRIIIALVMGLMFSLGWFFCGVPSWFLIGMITGLLNIFPYVSVIGWPIAILMQYIDFLTTGTPPDFQNEVYIHPEALNTWGGASGIGDATLSTAGEASVQSSFSWMSIFFWPSFVFMLVQFIEGWFLTPLIQSRSTDLSAVTILIVVLVGGALGGLYGLLLAIPVMACIKIVLKEFILPQLEEWAEHN